MSQAPPSQQISACSLWQGVSWIFLPKEVRLFWDTSAELDGDKAFFVAIRCCFAIYPHISSLNAILLFSFPVFPFIWEMKTKPLTEKTHPL